MNGLVLIALLIFIYVMIGVFLAGKEWMRQKGSLAFQKIESDDPGKGVVDPGIYDSDYYINTGSIEDLAHLPVHLSRCFDVACLQSGDKILDLGCGKGQLVYHCVLQGYSATAVDYSEAAVLLANKTRSLLPEGIRDRMTVLKMDFHDLPEDNKYHVIFMSDLVEHLYDWQLKELFDKLKRLLESKTGRIVIHTAPNKYFIDVIFPLKRILGWPAVIRKTGPKGSFFYTRNKYFYDLAMHVNEQTPGSLKKHLRDFKAKVWCEDGSANVLSQITKSFAGADIWAVARNKNFSKM
jgi:2-polyprenyl-3-methyl-5-hydroxy-6-metoxy-1,4-benzoquinol methylase